MIQKTGMNNISFKAAYLNENEETKKVMEKGRLFDIQGKKLPFPRSDFDSVVKTLAGYTDDCHCDIVFSFNDHGDTFTTNVELYDRRYPDEPFDDFEDDTCEYAKTEDKTPFIGMYVDAFLRIGRYFRLTDYDPPRKGS